MVTNCDYQFHEEIDMYAQAAIKPNTLLRNGAYGIVMRAVQNKGADHRLRNRGCWYRLSA